MAFIKKENLTISVGEYEKDGVMKKQWKTIGEIITMSGDDGQPYQFFKLWGAGGVVEGKVFEQQEQSQGFAPQGQQPTQGYAQQPQQPMQPQQGYGQPMQPQQAPMQGNNAGFQQPPAVGAKAPQPANSFDNFDSDIPFSNYQLKAFLA